MGDSQETSSDPERVTPEQEQRLLDLPTQAMPAPLRADARRLVAGQTLGPFRIVAQLGEGGMAHVYLGERADGARAALKVLRQDEAEADPTLWDRFEREAQVMARLAHPNLVRLLERGVERSIHYMALEHVPGSDLSTILARCPARKFSVPEATLVLTHCARGLAAVHAAGVLHRDLKPANVLITRRGQVKLIDFGIALAGDHTQRLTERDYVIGTLLYLAPEVLVESAWAPPADVYALGCVAYRMLTGTLPYVQRRLKDLLRAHRDELPASVASHEAEVPPALDALVMRMLDHDPDRRPSAAEVAETLTGLGLEQQTLVAQQWARGRVGSGEFGVLPAPTADDGNDDEPTGAEEVALARLATRSAPPIDSGQRLGPFEVERFLDRGAMGDVYLCRRDGARFAVKLIAEALLEDEESLARFDREVEALIQMGPHPGIAAVRAHGRTPGGRPWFATDYAEGRSLRHALEAGLEQPAALDALERVAETLAAAHARGVVHRDVKPDNVLLTADGRCLLLDFGLTKAVGRHTQSLTRTGEILGTPSFMAPEQVDPDLGAIGPWTDVYQLGCLLYRVLAGRPPYTGATAVEVYSQLLRGDPITPLRKLAPDLEPGLAQLCDTALARDPGDRYRDAGVLLQELRRELAPRDHTLRALVLVCTLSVVLAGAALLVTQLRTTTFTPNDRSQDVARLRGLLAEGRYAAAVDAGEALLAGEPAGGTERAAALGEITDLLDAARSARAGEVFRSGDTRAAAALLARVQAPPPEAPWILAAAGDPAGALAALRADEPAQRARLAAWAGDAEAYAQALAQVEVGRREALAWSLREYTGLTPAAAARGGGPGWKRLAEAERYLALGLTSLAADGFARVRGEGELAFAARLGELRTALARGTWRDGMRAVEAALPLAQHPLDLPRLYGWAWALRAFSGVMRPAEAEQVKAWCSEAERRAPGLRRGQADAPAGWLRRARELARGDLAAGSAALGIEAGRFWHADYEACALGLGGPEGTFLARGFQLAAASYRGHDPGTAKTAEALLEAALALEPDAVSGWVGLAQARLARDAGAEALEALAGARERVADPALAPWELEALVASWTPRAVAADRARAAGSPDAALELELARDWLHALELCQRRREEAPGLAGELGLWAARCRVERARRLVAAGSESLLAPSEDLLALLEGVEADVAPALAGVDVLALVRARVALGRALLDGDDPAAAAAAQALVVASPAQPEQALQALALRAAAWPREGRLHAEAYLALAADLPARVAGLLRHAQRDGSDPRVLERALALRPDDAAALLLRELAKLSEAVVTPFGADADAFRALARILEREPGWLGTVSLALAAQPLAPAGLPACLEGLGADESLARGLACYAVSLGAVEAEVRADVVARGLAALQPALAHRACASAAHGLRVLLLVRVGRGAGLAAPDPLVEFELDHAVTAAIASAPHALGLRQAGVFLPDLGFALVPDLLAEGLPLAALRTALDGSSPVPAELERELSRLGGQGQTWTRGASARLAWEAARQAREALEAEDPARAAVHAAEALARWPLGPPPAPRPLPRLHGALPAELARRTWPDPDLAWRRAYVEPGAARGDLVRALERLDRLDADPPLAGTVAFLPWSRAAALLELPQDVRLQAASAAWLLEPDGLETRLALERVWAFGAEPGRALAEATYVELVPLARALDPRGAQAAWRAIGSAAERALLDGAGDDVTRAALRALAVEALLVQAAGSGAGVAGALEAAWGYAREGDRVERGWEGAHWGAWRRVRLLVAGGRGGPALAQASRALDERLARADDGQREAWRQAARVDPWTPRVLADPASAGLRRWLGD